MGIFKTRSKKYPNAAAALLHYLQNSGADYSIDLEGLLKDARSAKVDYESELAAAKAFASPLRDGIYLITSRQLTQGAGLIHDNDDWFLTLGRYAAWGKGKVKVCNGTITLQFKYTLAKRYQWEVGTGKSVPFGPFGIFKVTDEEVAELQERGYAKEYNIRSSRTETVTWQKQ